MQNEYEIEVSVSLVIREEAGRIWRRACYEKSRSYN